MVKDSQTEAEERLPARAAVQTNRRVCMTDWPCRSRGGQVAGGTNQVLSRMHVEAFLLKLTWVPAQLV